MLTRLNGWQRIGVVASVIWLCFVSFAAIDSLNSGQGAFTHTIKGKDGYCLKHEPAKPRVSDKNPPTAEEFFKQMGAVCLAENYVKATPDTTYFSWRSFLSMLLLPLVFGWFGAYLLIYVVRWVANGFRRSAT